MSPSKKCVTQIMSRFPFQKLSLGTFPSKWSLSIQSHLFRATYWWIFSDINGTTTQISRTNQFETVQKTDRQSLQKDIRSRGKINIKYNINIYNKYFILYENMSFHMVSEDRQKVLS
ncbi:hypothetical protein DPEC_G00325170 [Dallia pectoralis]|uniref:Uncharacterized protein n=1 Tax=Dallia pectoralis TaxID=75939 RepID=A0ACC2FB80_DALPE|nr:hypothetical protein DPEC_G00325170 [Dallia pectoralis]